MVAVAKGWDTPQGGMDRDEGGSSAEKAERRQWKEGHALCAWRRLLLW